MNRLLPYLRRHLKEYIVGFCLLVLTNAMALMVPRIFKTAVDSLTMLHRASQSGASISANDVSFLTNGAIAATALIVMMAVFRVGSRVYLFYVGRRVEAELRDDLFAHLLTLDPGFYEEKSTGELMSRSVNDINNVRSLAGFCILNIMNTFTQGLLVISQMIAFSPLLTLYSIVPLPLLIVSVRRISRGLFRKSMEVQEGLADLSGFVHEDLTGLGTLQAYAREDNERKLFAVSNAKYLEQNLGLARIRSYVAGVMVAYGGIGSLVVLGLGGRAVINGNITIGTLLAFGMYLTMLTWPTMALGWLITLIQRGMASWRRIEEVMDRKSSVEVADPAQVEEVKGEVEFDGLKFQYAKTAENQNGRKAFALRGISEHIGAGARAAIVGPTGSGKSTLVKFIPRLIEVQGGSIKLDGVEVKRIPLDTLRGAVAFVSQEPFLFSATIHNNVAMGKPDADPTSVHRAIRMAGLEPDLEEFPKGDNTVVGERGITLSGGQRQRVALARALLSDPPLLILDDVFSSVDAHTEKAILAELKEYMKGRTSIVITHRLSAVREFDFILVVDDGRVVERGTHGELMERGGLYRKLVERQAIEEELEKL